MTIQTKSALTRGREALNAGDYEAAGSILDDAEGAQAGLLTALQDLRKELHAHFKLDVRKHYSLMVADAAAGNAIAGARQP